MKKAYSLLLAIVLLLLCALPASASKAPTVSPQYVNTSQAKLNFVIAEDGTATFSVNIIGEPTATGIYAVTRLLRKSGSAWYLVDLGTPGMMQYYQTTSSAMYKTYTHTVTSHGEYKVVTDVTVYGTESDETFTLSNTYTY